MCEEIQRSTKMDREIVKYDIVTGENSKALQKLVTNSIKEGWVPQGGIALNSSGHPMQAVVQYKSPNQN